MSDPVIVVPAIIVAAHVAIYALRVWLRCDQPIPPRP